MQLDHAERNSPSYIDMRTDGNTVYIIIIIYQTQYGERFIQKVFLQNIPPLRQEFFYIKLPRVNSICSNHK